MTIPIQNKNPKLIKIIDEDTLKFQCKVCSQIWLAGILPGGEISWQCPNGCIADCKKKQGAMIMTSEEQDIISKIETENSVINKYLADLIKTIGKLRTSQVRITFFTGQLKAKGVKG